MVVQLLPRGLLVRRTGVRSLPSKSEIPRSSESTCRGIRGPPPPQDPPSLQMHLRLAEQRNQSRHAANRHAPRSTVYLKQWWLWRFVQGFCSFRSVAIQWSQISRQLPGVYHLVRTMGLGEMTGRACRRRLPAWTSTAGWSSDGRLLQLRGVGGSVHAAFERPSTDASCSLHLAGLAKRLLVAMLMHHSFHPDRTFDVVSRIRERLRGHCVGDLQAQTGLTSFPRASSQKQ